MKKYKFISTHTRFDRALCTVPRSESIEFLSTSQQIGWLKVVQALSTLYARRADLKVKAAMLLKSQYVAMSVSDDRMPCPLDELLSLAGNLHEACVESGLRPTPEMLQLNSSFLSPLAQSERPGLWSPFLAAGLPKCIITPPMKISSVGACIPGFHTHHEYNDMHVSDASVTVISSPAPYDEQDRAT
jgi:hypothetical protein